MSLALAAPTAVDQEFVFSGADFERVATAVRSDPLFFDEETLVFPVDRIAALEEEGNGMLLERHGAAGGAHHQHLLFEGRFDRTSLAAQVMIAASRALPSRRPGAWSLFDLPLRALTDGAHRSAESQWM